MCVPLCPLWTDLLPGRKKEMARQGQGWGKMGRSPATELVFISKVSGYLTAVPHTQDLQSETQVWADLPWSHGETEIDRIQHSQNTQLRSSIALTAIYVNEYTAANTHWAPSPDAKAVLCTKPGLCGAQAQLATSCIFPPSHGSFKGATMRKAVALQVVSNHSIN